MNPVCSIVFYFDFFIVDCQDQRLSRRIYPGLQCDSHLITNDTN